MRVQKRPHHRTCDELFGHDPLAAPRRSDRSTEALAARLEIASGTLRYGYEVDMAKTGRRPSTVGAEPRSHRRRAKTSEDERRFRRALASARSGCVEGFHDRRRSHSSSDTRRSERVEEEYAVAA